MSIAVTTQIICFSVLSLVVIIGALGVILLENIVYSAFLLGGVFMSVAGLYLLLNASFVAAAQVLVYVGAVNVLIIFAIMLVNKKEDLKAIENIKSRRIISTSICLTLLSLLIRVDLSNTWGLAESNASIGEESTIRIGEHLFSDYLLPFEVASVLLLMAMIGAIVLARRDVMNEDISTGLPVDQELIEKPNEPLLIKKN
ncbi:NADH-quinone oxidoreductase subunit J [uncultured Prochlorococcus sp.]|jgi:NAD(P)H-quinone oxidoreductase subunit 6|uniref:NADH-quinone oxidoreductase subunit J n=1 Tax=Prochlorococcus sp. TaxID=1220 RepID=UPI000C6B88A5|nr:NADH-quinone oxidoreductase subunit J [uncultured Prochlorococcus sp.]MAK08436.1 NADH:ubiquinone oxidoreductase subunit J [Prochlorococcus sp. MED105]RCL50087.1 MAG: NADH-quinone oxidoreductase subunit J [Prochlorococcus sp. MED-G72]|tara:strand:+ start:1428 stop:2027 length:600 start_codon:yes stop_codon:yes gene_type:complete